MYLLDNFAVGIKFLGGVSKILSYIYQNVRRISFWEHRDEDWVSLSPCLGPVSVGPIGTAQEDIVKTHNLNDNEKWACGIEGDVSKNSKKTNSGGARLTGTLQ